MIKFEMLDKRYTEEALGYIPSFLSPHGTQTAREQLDSNYRHGGGWTKFEGFRLDPSDMSLNYSGDPPMKPIAKAQLHGESIYIYPHAWVLIMHNGVWEVARMD